MQRRDMMAKTVTLRIDDDTYEILKKAAEGDRRTLSNFIEYATLSYVTSETYVTEQEMREVLEDPDLVKGLRQARTDVDKGKYHIVG
jgi:uncharacterized protein (DUF1778 family)